MAKDLIHRVNPKFRINAAKSKESLDLRILRAFSDNYEMKIESGNYVIAILHTPREKLFGVLEEINASGVFLRGIDLGYFEDWCAAIASGEPYLPMTDYFFPMWRLERMTKDEGTPEMPSLAQQCETRTGKPPAMY